MFGERTKDEHKTKRKGKRGSRGLGQRKTRAHPAGNKMERNLWSWPTPNQRNWFLVALLIVFLASVLQTLGTR